MDSNYSELFFNLKDDFVSNGLSCWLCGMITDIGTGGLEDLAFLMCASESDRDRSMQGLSQDWEFTSPKNIIKKGWVCKILNFKTYKKMLKNDLKKLKNTPSTNGITRPKDG